MTHLHTEDQEMLRGVLAGNRASLALFARRFEPLFRRHVRRVCKGAAPRFLEDDLVQEIFLDLFQGGLSPLRVWDPRLGSSLSVFLGWYAARRAVSALRRLGRSRRQEVALFHPEDPAAAPQSPDSGGRLWAQQQLARVLSALTPDERELLVCLHLQQTSVADTCTRLGMSRQALYQRRHRLLKRLRCMKLAA